MAAKLAKWRAALHTLNEVLEDVAQKETPGNLLEAKLELASTLATLSGFVRSRGCGELIERMVLAAKNAAPDTKIADIYKLFTTLSVKLRVRVKRVRANSVGASASGEWCLCGKSYAITAIITEKDGERSGNIVLEGLGLNAEGSLAEGKGKLDGCEDEAKNWISESRMNMTPKDAIRVVAVGLEILTKERVKGVADVDIPEVMFDLLRGHLGLASLEQLECSTEISPDEDEQQESNDADDDVDEEDADEIDAEADVDDVEDASDNASEKEGKAEEEQESEVEGELKDGEPQKDNNFQVGDMVEVINGFRLPGSATRLQKGWKGLIESIDEDGHAFISFCDGLKGEWLSSDEFPELSKLKSETGQENLEAGKPELSKLKPETGQENLEAGKNEDADSEEEEDDDADKMADETECVSKRVLASIKGKLVQGSVPTQADITKLLDVSALPDDEDLVSLDISVLEIESPDVLSSKKTVAQAVSALIKKYGLKGTAELCVKAEIVEPEEDEDEEEGEEEEEEEEGEEDVSVDEKVELNVKRVVQKGREREAEVESARKRARGVAGA